MRSLFGKNGKENGAGTEKGEPKATCSNDIARADDNKAVTCTYESVAEMTLTAVPECDNQNNGSARPLLVANQSHALPGSSRRGQHLGARDPSLAWRLDFMSSDGKGLRAGLARRKTGREVMDQSGGHSYTAKEAVVACIGACMACGSSYEECVLVFF